MASLLRILICALIIVKEVYSFVPTTHHLLTPIQNAAQAKETENMLKMGSEESLVTKLKKPVASLLAVTTLVLSPISSEPVLANPVIAQGLEQFKTSKTNEQQKRLLDVEKEELQRELKTDITDIIAKGEISIPSKDYPLGLDDATLLEGFEGKKSALFIAAYGNKGPPIAAKKYLLSEIRFPLAFELTKQDLLFPYTASAWEKDPQSKEKLGIVALLDTDGIIATVSENDQVAAAESKPIKIAGSFLRTEGKLVMKKRPNTDPYAPSEVSKLQKIDAQLEARRARENSQILASSNI